MKIRGLSLLRRYPIPALILLLLLIALSLMSLRARQQKGIAFLDALLMEVCSPFQRASTFVIQTVHQTFQQYLFLVHLQRENEMLKQRMAELQKENHLKEEALLANERLRNLLQFREKFSTSIVAAEVIGQDPSSWFKSVTINKGERDGIRKGMAVISPDGSGGSDPQDGSPLCDGPSHHRLQQRHRFDRPEDPGPCHRGRKGRKSVSTEIPPPDRRGQRGGCHHDLGVGWKFSKGPPDR